MKKCLGLVLLFNIVVLNSSSSSVSRENFNETENIVHCEKTDSVGGGLFAISAGFGLYYMLVDSSKDGAINGVMLFGALGILKKTFTS